MVLGTLCVPYISLRLGQLAVGLRHPPHFLLKILRGRLRERPLYRSGAVIHQRVQPHVAGAEKTEAEFRIGGPLEFLRLEELIDLSAATTGAREQCGLPISHPAD